MTSNQIDLSPESLKRVAKQVKINAELKELEIKVEKLKIRSEIEDLDISSELEQFNDELTRLKNEKEKNQLDGQHPIFELVQKQNIMQERLKKLNEKKSQIQPAVYKSLKDEYLGEKEEISLYIKETITKLKEIKKAASKGGQTLKYSIEELSVRKEIEEIPDDVFQKQINDLKAEYSQSEELITAVNFLLKMVRD
ncbi:MAG: hypothetical protein ACXACU_04585 [Candidatus Hodarchaeales archaeon]|jgi:hypothetical protein